MREQLIAQQFRICGEVTGIEQIKKGYINQTYRVDTRDGEGRAYSYILQHINTGVFPNADALMENYAYVTDRLRGHFHLEGGRPDQNCVPLPILTREGRRYLLQNGECWRMIDCFTGVHSMDIPDNAETFYYAGRSFGRFIMELQSVSVARVHEVIPNFHNTYSRYLDLEEAIARDPVGRAAGVAAEIEFIRARRDYFGLIADALAEGRIPLRITHNDTNLNNILFSNDTNLPVAVIDLDTVMPSTPLYDFGDSIRIGANTACDDEHDLEKVSCSLELYESYARGWLEACGSMLTTEELELLPMAALIITSEDGIRFLMDHINGDTYYNIFYPDQNLYRARTQLKMVADMEGKLPLIREMFDRIYRDLQLKTN